MGTIDVSAHRSPTEQSDAALISRVRAGDTTAGELLYERHAAAARALARHLTEGEAAAEGAVAETYAKVLDVLRHGGGPQAGFRPYLLVSLRRTISDRAGPRPHDPAEPFVDPALRGLETNMIARAFLSLPERWQAVLWHTEIESWRPAQAAPLLGLTANGVAALAYRAREGLRQAYLQMHLAESARRPCRPALDKLGGYLRGGLPERDSAQVERHLDGCEDCAATYVELADVKAVLRTIVGPLVLGTAAADYLAGVTGGGALGGLRRAWRQLPKLQWRALGAGTAGTRR
jgi:DNA-directed RNA polymerase specialized sigma24 family protein